MAFSLGFHIIFAAVGMVMPFFMFASQVSFNRRKNYHDLQLTNMWSKGVAVIFATGAVSGTVLSFELGLLWPGFMEHAGPIIGMPFSWEGTAFFLEAIALGIFLYGRDKLPVWAHTLSGLVVGVAGLASGIFIVSANSWMNTPAGFDWVNGAAINVDPVKAMFNKHWLQQSVHMALASFEAVGFAVAGIHALFYLNGKNKALNTSAIHISLTFAAIAALLQPISGHFSAQQVAKNQPVKLAAMESHFETEQGASLVIGGIPDTESRTIKGAIRLPKLLSFLAFNDFSAEVKGLNDFPREEWPPVLIVHLAFQLMVALGSLLTVIGAVFFFLRWRKKSLPRWFLKTLVCAIPMGFLALEAGWVVTEVGRQPWIVYGIMKTADAVTPMPGIGFHFLLFLLVYLFTATLCVFLLYRLMVHTQKGAEEVSRG